MKTPGVIAGLEYPPYTFDESFPDVAKSILEKLRVMEQQLPKLRAHLELLRGKWGRALSVYQQTRKPNPIVAQKNATLPALSLKSARYTNARLVGVTYDSATIGHDAGVAKAPLTELTVPEIVSLNATSNSLQLGTMPFFDQQAVRGNSVTQRVRTAGMRVLAFIASRTGLAYDTVHTWLVFIIFPALIIALTIPYAVRLRRPKLLPIQRAR